MIKIILLIIFATIFIKLLTIVGRKTLLIAAFAPLFVLLMFLISPSCVQNQIEDSIKTDTIISTFGDVIYNSKKSLNKE